MSLRQAPERAGGSVAWRTALDESGVRGMARCGCWARERAARERERERGLAVGSPTSPQADSVAGHAAREAPG